MANPLFSEKALKGNEQILIGEPMTISGTINRTLFLFICLLSTSFYEYFLFSQGYTDKAKALMMCGFVSSIVIFLIIMFVRKTLKYLAPFYTLSQGLVLGGLSSIFETMYPGIVLQAVGSTFMAFFVMLLFYKTKLIKCTEKFRSVMMISMCSILGIYLVQIIGSFFGLSIPGLFESGYVGIGFSIFVCIIAALNFIIDFHYIETGVENLLDKSYEWYCAFTLMLTFIWLYVEILRLISKFRSR